MVLTLKQANAIQALAHSLCEFLPGSGAKEWSKHITFGTVAERAGVGQFWDSKGSKIPRLVALLENTLQHQPQSFERLIIGIVKEGLRYRRTKGEPIKPDEIKYINGHLLELGFKFPDLWDTSFTDSLMLDDAERAEKNIQQAELNLDIRESSRIEKLRALDQLKRELEALVLLADRQAAGYGLEALLNRMFKLFDLAPRRPFKVTGEQIDGSFELDHEVYLVEAKWEHTPLPERDLLVFRGKIEGKSAFTRGVFIAMNGVTRDAEAALRIGKQSTFFVITGHDLMNVLQGALSLDEFLRRRWRLLAEEAAVTALFSASARITDPIRQLREPDLPPRWPGTAPLFSRGHLVEFRRNSDNWSHTSSGQLPSHCDELPHRAPVR